MNSILKFGAAAAAIVAAVSPAQSAIVAWNGTGANDSIDWAQLGSNGTLVPSGSAVVSTGGLNATVTSSSGNDLQRLDQGAGWGGNFGPGETLLFNAHTSGDIIITFAAPVSAGGAQFQQNQFGPFVARITTSDGSFFDFAGTSNSNGDDSAIFVGAISDSASITSITFRDLTSENNFAIGDLSLITGGVNPIPEPATWAMMIGGFGLVGAAMRRRAKVSVRYA